MTKAEFIRKVARDSQSPYQVSKAWTIVVLNALIDAVVKEDKVEIQNLGVFEHAIRDSNKGRNRITGDVFPLPPYTVLKFRPCKGVKQAIREHPVTETQLAQVQAQREQKAAAKAASAARRKAWLETHPEEAAKYRQEAEAKVAAARAAAEKAVSRTNES